MRTQELTWVAALLGLAAWAGSAAAYDGYMLTAHHALPAPAATPVKLVDTLLQDQDGRRLRLADALGDKVVAVTFVHTSGVDTFPLVSHTFAQVQQKLAGAMGDRVRLVSLTVDPARDTPARLKSYSSAVGAGPGWLWLTGAPASVTAALNGFGIHFRNVGSHPAVVLVGDPRSGRWTRLYDIERPDQVLAAINEHLAARHDGVAGSGLRQVQCAHPPRSTAKSVCVTQQAG